MSVVLGRCGSPRTLTRIVTPDQRSQRREWKRKAAGPADKKKRPASLPSDPDPQAEVWRFARWVLVAGLVGLLLMTGGFVYLYRSTDIPDPNKDFETQTSFVYYADGKAEVGSFATQNRESIPIKEMPDDLQNAVVAAENRTFWSDSGIDPRGILRAAFSNAKGNSTQGASTITQQYVKILYLTQERSYERKMKEAVLSLKLQRTKSKTEILEGYLNTIYFGRGAYGVQAAAKAYFASRRQGPRPCVSRPCSPACSTTRRASTRPTARTRASRSRSATSTCSTGWPRPATSPPTRPRRPSAGCRSSRRSRPRAGTAARRATCSTMVRAS